jgi:cytoskeletal protein CcmA (bactofilin family)
LIVGELIRIHGTIEGDEDLVVRGRVEGAVRIAGKVTVEPGGWLQADVEAREVAILGTVRGNVTARESIEVARTARMIGDAVAPRVTIVAGAGFRGRVEMGDAEAVPAALEQPRSPPALAAPRSTESPATDPPAERPIPRLARPSGPLRRRAET